MTYKLYKEKKIGIWGFGKTGQSVLTFLAPYAKNITIVEAGSVSEEQHALIKKYSAQLVPYEHLTQFLEYNDVIIPSPGVDLGAYQDYSEKFLSELDLFAQHVAVKTIAITGSVGKTSTVTLLTELLNKLGIKAIAAGNIGTPLLDVLAIQKNYNVLVLELSSFQLEHSTTFAPSIAALTNLFPNHLDRHKTLFDYAHAKGQLFAMQTQTDWAIIPMEFLDACISYTKHQKVVWLSQDAYKVNITKELSDVTFEKNWQLIFAILETMGIDIDKAVPHCTALTVPAHRFENLGTHQGITFFNDSKATIPESTLESVKRCTDRPTILFLGGVSKGVDRTPFIKELPKNLKAIFCFGKEAHTLHTVCLQQKLPSSSYQTLEEAWRACITQAVTGDTVLFSPAGASFDLFKNYEERGILFKKLVSEFKEKNNQSKP